jgi:predicted benzoate:H+ symporter BenE
VRVLSADVKASRAALVVFLVAVTRFAVLGISSAFWALLAAGRAASALLERGERLKQWRA